jgi:glutamate formiminotransferase
MSAITKHMTDHKRAGQAELRPKLPVTIKTMNPAAQTATQIAIRPHRRRRRGGAFIAVA